MIMVITDLGYDNYHQRRVGSACNQIQNDGYDVIEIKRISKCWFLCGSNTTHIYYE